MHTNKGPRRVFSAIGMFFGIAILASGTAACAAKKSSSSSSNSTCTFTVTGAATSTSAVACSAVIAQDSGFWQIEISQDSTNGAPTFAGLNCVLSVNGNAPTPGMYTQDTMSASICTLNSPGDTGDEANVWEQKGAPMGMGTVSLTVSSVDATMAGAGYGPHGSASFTLIGRGTNTGTVMGSVTF